MAFLGSTALHHACSAQSRKMVNFLIANKCNLNIKDNNGKTAIELADDNTMLEFMQSILICEEEKKNGLNHVIQFLSKFIFNLKWFRDPQC
jgi:hypothetical protein